MFMGLLNESGLLSLEGRMAARLPLEPRHAAAFIRALRSQPSPVWEVSAIVSLLNEEKIFVFTGPNPEWPGMIHANFKHPHGDAMTLLNLWHGFYRQEAIICAGKSAAARAEHLRHWCDVYFLSYEGLTSASRTFAILLGVAHEEMNMSPDEKVLPATASTMATPRYSQVVRKSLLKAGFMQIAVREPQGDGYRTLGENNPGLIDANSAMVGREYDFVMYDTFLRTSRCFFKNVTGIDSRWLFEDPLSSAYVNSLLTGYIKNSEKWFPIKQLAAAKVKFENTTK